MNIPDTTPEVDAIGSMALEGNVIPWSWFERMRFPNGKPDLNAIIILADIVYWYRPTPEHDETTGKILGWKKRFKADLLQRSYASYAEQFGLTKRQVTDALTRLQNVHHVICLVFRTIDTTQGKLANVLFIQPLTENINAITHQRDTSHVSTGYLPRLNGIPPPIERETYTGITTEITTGKEDLPYRPPPRTNGKSSRRAPTDFTITNELRTWAMQTVPSVDLTRETATFLDHEFAHGRTDWPATWRNWMRKAAERLPRIPQQILPLQRERLPL